MRVLIVLFFTVILTTACSSKLAYDNIDWLIMWYVDDYIELNDDQEKLLKTKINTWKKWHQQNEMPQYIAQLENLKSLIIGGPVSAELVEQNIDMADDHWNRLRAYLAPQLAEFAPTLSEDQIVYLFATLARENRESREELGEFNQKSDAEQLQERTEQISDMVSDYIGKLTNEQATIVAANSKLFKRTKKEWINYREETQKIARKIFVVEKSQDAMITQMTALMSNPDQYRSAALTFARDHNKQALAKMISELAPTLSDKQKSRLINKVDDIIEDLRVLMD